MQELTEMVQRFTVLNQRAATLVIQQRREAQAGRPACCKDQGRGAMLLASSRQTPMKADADESSSSSAVSYQPSRQHSKFQATGTQSFDYRYAADYETYELFQARDFSKDYEDNAPKSGIQDSEYRLLNNLQNESPVECAEIALTNRNVAKVGISIPIDQSDDALSGVEGDSTINSPRHNRRRKIASVFSSASGEINSDSMELGSSSFSAEKTASSSQSFSLSFSLSFDDGEIEVEIVEGSVPHKHNNEQKRELSDLRIPELRAEAGIRSARTLSAKLIKPQKPVRPGGSAHDSTAPKAKHARIPSMEQFIPPLENQQDSPHSIMSQSTLIDEQDEKLIGNSSLIQPQKLQETISILAAKNANTDAQITHSRNQLIASTNKLPRTESVSILENANEDNLLDPGVRSPLIRQQTDEFDDEFGDLGIYNKVSGFKTGKK